MQKQLTGHAWSFGGLLDCDVELCPRTCKEEIRARAFASGKKITFEDFAPYCMQLVDPTFAKRVQPGDFIVGDEGVGYGHDHHQASMSMRGCKIGAVLCESATTYFQRISINLGLLVLQVPGIFAATTTGDELEVDLDAGKVTNKTTGWTGSFGKFPDYIMEIIEAGGIHELIESTL